MLATSLSRDLYERFFKPGATDRQVLRVARNASIAGAAFGVALAIVSESITQALSIFYTLLSVSLFVPIVAGLYMRRPGPIDSLAAIAGGVSAVIAAQLWNGGRPIGFFTPAMCGLAGAFLAFALAAMFAPHSGSSSPARAKS
jgi:solute:Na+ symporter, SSS family